MNYDFGFDDETNETFIIYEDGTIIYFDEIPDIILTFIETI